MSKLGGNYKHHFNHSLDWQTAPAKTFWGSIASKDHIVQIYGEENVMISSMADFVIGGITSGECSVVFLTLDHLAALDEKLKEKGFFPETLISNRLYFPFNAEEILKKFLVDNWPDTPLLYLTISELLSSVTATGRKMRAAGEMVSILRERELIEATIQLEKIWKEIYEKDPFCIFCVYPRRIFDVDIFNSELSICCQHTKIIEGIQYQKGEVRYHQFNEDQHITKKFLSMR